MKGSFDLALAIAILLIGTIVFFFSFFSINTDPQRVQEFFNDPVGDVLSNSVETAAGDVRIARVCGWNDLLTQVQGLIQNLSAVFGPDVTGFLFLGTPGGGAQAWQVRANDEPTQVDDVGLLTWLSDEAQNHNCPLCMVVAIINNEGTSVSQCCLPPTNQDTNPGTNITCVNNQDCALGMACLPDGDRFTCQMCPPGQAPAGQLVYDFDSSFFALYGLSLFHRVSGRTEGGDFGCVSCPEGTSVFDFCNCPPPTAPDGEGSCTECRPGFRRQGNDCVPEGSTGGTGSGGSFGSGGSSGSGGGLGSSGGPGGSAGNNDPSP